MGIPGGKGNLRVSDGVGEYAAAFVMALEKSAGEASAPHHQSVGLGAFTPSC